MPSRRPSSSRGAALALSATPTQGKQVLIGELAPVRGILPDASYDILALEDQRRFTAPIERWRRQLVHEPGNAVDEDRTRGTLRFTQNGGKLVRVIIHLVVTPGTGTHVHRDLRA